MGVCQVMEGRHCFQHLTVEENLLTGAFTRKGSRADTGEALEKVYHYFPRLKQRRGSQAGYTSGGEQQMTAIGRGLMGKPLVLMLDEPSLGLAPILVDEVFRVIADIATRGVTVLLVEQNVHRALEVASTASVIENGRVVLSKSASEMADDPNVRTAYLGL
jgi:branched-chain amino acid transport system ATP-binding protein